MILTVGLGVVCLIYGLFFDGFIRKIPKWIWGCFWGAVSLVVVFVIFLYVYGNIDNVTYDEHAMRVLGCGVKGEEPTESLKSRLEAAVEYYHKNPNAIIVVSGGKGASEDITEALAMERYLMDRGIPQDRIIKEEQSTNTYENFKYSKKILDKYFDEAYSVAYITNDYHIFRAGNISEKIGFENATHYSAGTPWYMIVSSGLRECVGVMKFIVFGE